MQEAIYWKSAANQSVICELCPHNCHIQAGETGICGVRENRDGVLYSLVYGLACSSAVDPVEKKPLYHVLPGELAFSIATVGCNLRCKFCQNASISQYPLEHAGVAGDQFSPQDVVAQAQNNGCKMIAYTYTEPTIYMEYVLDTARIAQKEVILNVLVSNGYTSTKLIENELAGLIDAANIDLKAFSDSFYKRLCGARLQPVLDAIQAYHAAGIWLELTTLLIPGENDDGAELRELAKFIADLDQNIPWHISRYHPCYQYTQAAPTPLAELERARNIGLEAGLNFVYTGNVSHAGDNSYCPGCGRQIISRDGFYMREKKMTANCCTYCRQVIAGRF